MGPFFDYNQIKNQYTLQELRGLSTMNYNFTSSFLSSNSLNPAFSNAIIISNHHPYTTKLLYDLSWNVNPP